MRIVNIEKIKSDQFEIQRAIKFLADRILDNHGQQIPLKTDKPLLIHCLRVGMMLYDFGYDKEMVIAGILHDINEDIEVGFEEIERHFGQEVKELVFALTYNQSIPEGPERIQDAHNKKKAGGKRAIVISVADHLANLPYTRFVKEKPAYNKLIEKHQNFLSNLAKVANDEPIYAEYQHELSKYPLQ